MSKHTPGTWIAVGTWVEHPDQDRPDICVCDPKAFGQGDRSYEEAHANALLIAAAPDLLEALQFVMTAHGEQLDTAFAQAQDAIAKATGETQ